jgi:predicted HTH transcriptional regulator
VTEQDFAELLAPGHETNGVEFKGPGMRTDKSFLAKVVRAFLGMANRRDGGLVIIGVVESKSKQLEPVGLGDVQAASWLTYDDLSASVNEYASPNVSFDLEPLTYQEKEFVIVRVHEFDDIPVLCCKEFHETGKTAPTLRRGACYVRSRHKPETSEIPSEEEMRELLELATNKGVRRFVTRAQKAGLFPAIQAPPASPSDEELFRNQTEDLG